MYIFSFTVVYAGFMTPSVVSAGSGYDGTSQVANGNYVQPQTTHNEDETSGSKVRYRS